MIEKLDLTDEDLKQEVPDHAVPIDSRDDAPEDAEVIQGPRGGLYMIPAGEDEDTGEGTGEIDPGDELTADQLESGMHVEIFDEPAEILDVFPNEGPQGEAAIAFIREDGEDYVIFEDMLEGEIRATEGTARAESPDAPRGEGAEDGDADGPPIDPDADPQFSAVLDTFDSEAARMSSISPRRNHSTPWGDGHPRWTRG